MLRALVLALLLANIVYLVWVQSLLAPYGFGPASQAEPERLNQQIRPETMQLLKTSPSQPPAPAVSSAALAPAPASSMADNPAASASSAMPAASSAPAASVPVAAPVSAPARAVPVPALVQIAAPLKTPEIRQCLQAGFFTEHQASTMRSRLQAGLPKGSWSFITVKRPVRWIVYIGKYSSKAALQKRRTQLEQAGLSVSIPASPELNPGLSLGSYATQAQAKAAQAKLARRGIGSTQIEEDAPEQPDRLFRLPSADPALQGKARALIQQLSGQRLRSCG